MMYRDFYIDYIGLAPGDQFNYYFIHEDEDPEDATLCGFAKSVKDAEQKINEMYEDING